MKGLYWILMITTFCLALLISCKKDTPPDDNNTDITKDHGVFIVNEGNYMWSNASVSNYNFADGSSTEDIFDKVNHRPLGDVAQSISVVSGKAYLVVNNSNKIEIVDLATFTSSGVITGFTSPRYFLAVSATKAYVSDLYSNSISIVDLSSNTRIGSIPCKGSTEEMLLSGNEVYVTNTRTDKIYVINTYTDVVVDSIQVGFGSNSLAMDKNVKLWAFCAGDAANSIHASLFRVNTTTRLVEQSYSLPDGLDIWDKMRINAAKDTLYYMDHGIYQMSVTAVGLPSTPLIAQGISIFHGIGINTIDNTIFVADAVDYIQKGKVRYYSSTGALKGIITTGIIPVDFYFY
jgi:YVTN family beta-propeller protein